MCPCSARTDSQAQYHAESASRRSNMGLSGDWSSSAAIATPRVNERSAIEDLRNHLQLGAGRVDARTFWREPQAPVSQII
jgi:hypothetical protein